MGVDVCYTNHAEADQDDMDRLLTLSRRGGCNYIMGVPRAPTTSCSATSPPPFTTAITSPAGSRIAASRPSLKPGLESDAHHRQGRAASSPSPIPTLFWPMRPPRSEIAPAEARVSSHADAWSALRRFTSARIALGRAGGSWRTPTLLDFRMAHAQARDAVSFPFDADALERRLRESGCETARLSTAVGARDVFLKRPDLGRKLSATSRQLLTENAAIWGGRDLAIVVSDGLSGLAAERQVAPLLASLLPLLSGAGWTLCPVFLAPFARVKLQDEIGEILRVRQTLALLGERPGLGSPDDALARILPMNRGRIKPTLTEIVFLIFVRKDCRRTRLPRSSRNCSSNPLRKNAVVSS